MSKKATIKPVEQSEVASLYTISFENDNLSEFAKFMTNFKDNARLQRDCHTKRRTNAQTVQERTLVQSA